jgi:hypothetical protein
MRRMVGTPFARSAGRRFDVRAVIPWRLSPTLSQDGEDADGVKRGMRIER